MVTSDRPRFRHTLREMAENTTIHGIPKIVASKQPYMRVVWTIVFITTSGYLSFQLFKLFEGYFERPIKTTVTLKYNPLQFPAVSICNMNPIKRSFINITSDEVMAILSPDSVIRNNTLPKDEEFLLSNPSSSDSDEGGSGVDNVDSITDNHADNAINYNDDAVPHYDGDYYYYAPYNDYYPVDYIGGSFAYPNSNHDDLINELLSYDNVDAPKDRWIRRIESFKAAYMNEPREKRELIGHAIEDMLISCSFNARKCFSHDFTRFQSSEYGNCFTLESSNYFSRIPGPLNGLWLTLNLEILEYITNFVTGYGIKLLIHQPGTVVFPTVEGIVLSPGYETNIALKMVTVNRLGQPHGDCTEGQDFKKAFGIQYTIPACIKLCKYHWVVKMCDCIPGQIEDYTYNYYSYDYGIRKCRTNSPDDKLCQIKVEALYIKKSLDCSCGSPCKEVKYEKTISGRPWPNDVYLKYALVKEMCADKNKTNTKEFCARYLNNSKIVNITEARSNFLRAVIYYEDINYEVITESPLYDEFQFLSNIGGTLGLFLGASVLSAMEIIHFFIEIVIYFRRRVRHRKKIDHIKNISVLPYPKKVEKDVEKL